MCTSVPPPSASGASDGGAVPAGGILGGMAGGALVGTMGAGPFGTAIGALAGGVIGGFLGAEAVEQIFECFEGERQQTSGTKKEIFGGEFIPVE